jgi:hypothetical protein
MVCPLCPSAGFLGGIIGGYLGVNPPKSVGGRYLSILTTANLVSLTVFALKTLANISMCGSGGFTLFNVGLVVAKTLMMGIVYSIAVNHLLNRYVFLEQIKAPIQNEQPSCCCSETKQLTTAHS